MILQVPFKFYVPSQSHRTAQGDPKKDWRTSNSISLRCRNPTVLLRVILRTNSAADLADLDVSRNPTVLLRVIPSQLALEIEPVGTKLSQFHRTAKVDSKDLSCNPA